MKHYAILIGILLPTLYCSPKATMLPIQGYPAMSDNNVIADANNRFAFDLYRQIRNSEDNIFFSPFSISTAFAMTYAGARNNTGLQMGKVMYFGKNQAEFHQGYKDYLEQLLKEKQGIQLTTANSLWVQKDYRFLDDFFHITEENYSAPVHLVDYINPDEREKTRQEINKWVEGRTNKKIKNLIQSSDIDELTRLVLTNAIYFLGNWEKQFDPKLTESNPFHLDNVSTVETMFMKQKEDFAYYENEQIQYIELPYVSNQMSMGIILPKEVEGIKALEESIGYTNYQAWTKATVSQKVNILIPKVKTSFRIILNKALVDMGMEEAFSDDADFSGMTGDKDLKISAAIHQAFVEVNETGTEAAAATAVVMRMKSAFVAEEKFFTADHPFLFFIKDNQTGSILFMGRILNPKE